jgi:hypothetical protein
VFKMIVLGVCDHTCTIMEKSGADVDTTVYTRESALAHIAGELGLNVAITAPPTADTAERANQHPTTPGTPAEAASARVV